MTIKGYTSQEPLKVTKHCTGYTVLDSHRVITCQNDTIDYDWQMRIVR